MKTKKSGVSETGESNVIIVEETQDSAKEPNKNRTAESADTATTIQKPPVEVTIVETTLVSPNEPKSSPTSMKLLLSGVLLPKGLDKMSFIGLANAIDTKGKGNI